MAGTPEDRVAFESPPPSQGFSGWCLTCERLSSLWGPQREAKRSLLINKNGGFNMFQHAGLRCRTAPLAVRLLPIFVSAARFFVIKIYPLMAQRVAGGPRIFASETSHDLPLETAPWWGVFSWWTPPPTKRKQKSNNNHKVVLLLVSL